MKRNYMQGNRLAGVGLHIANGVRPLLPVTQ